MDVIILLVLGGVMLVSLALVAWLVVAVVRARKVSRRLRDRFGDLEAEVKKRARDKGPP